MSINISKSFKRVIKQNIIMINITSRPFANAYTNIKKYESERS